MLYIEEPKKFLRVIHLERSWFVDNSISPFSFTDILMRKRVLPYENKCNMPTKMTDNAESM